MLWNTECVLFWNLEAVFCSSKHSHSPIIPLMIPQSHVTEKLDPNPTTGPFRATEGLLFRPRSLDKTQGAWTSCRHSDWTSVQLWTLHKLWLSVTFSLPAGLYQWEHRTLRTQQVPLHAVVFLYGCCWGCFYRGYLQTTFNLRLSWQWHIVLQCQRAKRYKRKAQRQVEKAAVTEK